MKIWISVWLLMAGLAMSMAAGAAGDAAAGEAVYNKACKMCHASGMMGAPKSGDKAVWAPRIAQGEAVLVRHTIGSAYHRGPRQNAAQGQLQGLQRPGCRQRCYILGEAIAIALNSLR